MEREKHKSDLYFVLLLLACSLAFNVYQRLKLIDALSPPISVLQKGTSVGPITVADVAGKPASITFQNETKPTVLYVFTPPCHWCARNWNNMREIATQRESAYRFIGLSLGSDGLPGYIQSNRIPFPVYTKIAGEAVTRLKLGPTPETIVIAGDGRVSGVWTGAFTGKTAEAIQSYFGVTLPGLTADSLALQTLLPGSQKK